MTIRHPGGRGRKAEHKHITFTVSLPPDLKALLDDWTTPDTSRSEVVAQLIRDKVQLKEHQTTIEPLAELATDSLLQVVRVKVPSSLHWKSHRMAEVEQMLSEGKTLRREGLVWVTEKGQKLQHRAVEALLKVGNVQCS
jgi:hypothetical protein